MKTSFNRYRFVGRYFVGGWLEREVLAIIQVLDSAQQSKGIAGAVAEIGVHHGKLLIALNLLQDASERTVAIDIFDNQDLNIDQSGKGNLSVFRRNIQRWGNPRTLVIHQGDSTKLSADTLIQLTGGGARMFSVDGGHTESIVLNDMRLAEAACVPGGITIADDVFHESWPGVADGTHKYLAEGGQLIPFAIGFNKVFFTQPEYAARYREALTDHFSKRYLLFVKQSTFCGHDVLILARVRRGPKPLLRQVAIASNFYPRFKALQK